MSEKWQFITADNKTFSFDVGESRFVISSEGTGMPEMEDITQRGPFQHGETLLDYFLRPTIIQLIVLLKGCSRDEYWRNRQLLADAIRPNRGNNGIGKLRRIFSHDRAFIAGVNRDVRPQRMEIECKIIQGPKFEPRDLDRYSEREIKETLRFISYNPTWKVPELIKSNHAAYQEEQLIFPAEFPIIFGSTYMYFTFNLTYLGNWLEYPTILVKGPAKNPEIINNTTGEKLKLNYNVQAGRTAVFGLTYGDKFVKEYNTADLTAYELAYEALHPNKDGYPFMLEAILNGTLAPVSDLMIYLSNDSDLNDFHIECDPQAPLGVNNFTIIAIDIVGSSLITMAYYNRYIMLQHYTPALP